MNKKILLISSLAPALVLPAIAVVSCSNSTSSTIIESTKWFIRQNLINKFEDYNSYHSKPLDEIEKEIQSSQSENAGFKINSANKATELVDSSIASKGAVPQILVNFTLSVTNGDVSETNTSELQLTIRRTSTTAKTTVNASDLSLNSKTIQEAKAEVENPNWIITNKAKLLDGTTTLLVDNSDIVPNSISLTVGSSNTEGLLKFTLAKNAYYTYYSDDDQDNYKNKGKIATESSEFEVKITGFKQ